MSENPRDFNRFASILLATVIGLFGIVTGVSLTMAAWARSDVERVTEEYKAEVAVLSEDYRLWIVYISRVDAELRAHGIEPPPRPDAQKEPEQ